MAEKRLPSSAGGIMQYFEDYKNSFSIKPLHVIIATIVLVALVMIFNIFNPFGF